MRRVSVRREAYDHPSRFRRRGLPRANAGLDPSRHGLTPSALRCRRQRRGDRRGQRQPVRDRRRRATAWRSKVVHEPLRNIARARNTGARHVAGDMLVFVDADVTVPPALLHGIYEAMRDPACIGGAVDVDYRPRRFSVRIYLRASRLLELSRGRHTSIASPRSPGSAAMARPHGSARMSTSAVPSGGWPGRSTARSGSYERLAFDPGAGVSTLGPCGASWSGPIPSPSRCPGAARPLGLAGTLTPCGRAQGHRRVAANQALGGIPVVISPKEDYAEQSGSAGGRIGRILRLVPLPLDRDSL